MVSAGVAEDTQLPVPRRCESEAGVVAQFVAILGEMNLGAAVAVGFGVKIAVFYVRPHGEAHVKLRRQIGRPCAGHPGEGEQGGVPILQHVGRELDFHGPAVAGVCHKTPHRRPANLEGGQVLQIEGGNEAIGGNPDAKALDQDVTVHRKIRVEIGAEGAIIF